MTQINKQQWEIMLKTKHAFLPLSKGISGGEHTFMSEEMHSVRGMGQSEWVPKETFGVATLRPISLSTIAYFGNECPHMVVDYWGELQGCIMECEDKDGKLPFFVPNYEFGLVEHIDDETYNFVMENYIKKNIDFVIYEVSGIKENNDSKNKMNYYT